MAPRRHTTFRGLTDDMLDVVSNALLEVARDIKREEDSMIQERINTLVYDKIRPDNPDRRTFQFRDSAYLDYAEEEGYYGSDVTFQISHNEDEMESDPDHFIHGSNVWVESEDVRDMMGYIIENGAGPFFGAGRWMRPRLYSQQITEDLLRNSQLSRRVQKKIRGR
jgi:hypothetical protein